MRNILGLIILLVFTISNQSFGQTIASENPFTTRYTYTTNALPIKKHTNYSVINLYGPEIYYAVTNKLTVGIITTWFVSPLAIVSRYTIDTRYKNLNFSVSSILGTSGYWYKCRGYGILKSLTGTYGNNQNNFSLSAGFGFINNFINKNKFKGGPIFSIAGIKKIGKKTSLIFDSMLSITKNEEIVTQIIDNKPSEFPVYQTILRNVNVGTYVIIPGIRFQKVDYKAFQVSLISRISKNENKVISFPIPMCSWFYKL